MYYNILHTSEKGQESSFAVSALALSVERGVWNKCLDPLVHVLWRTRMVMRERAREGGRERLTNFSNLLLSDPPSSQTYRHMAPTQAADTPTHPDGHVQYTLQVNHTHPDGHVQYTLQVNHTHPDSHVQYTLQANHTPTHGYTHTLLAQIPSSILDTHLIIRISVATEVRMGESICCCNSLVRINR